MSNTLPQAAHVARGGGEAGGEAGGAVPRCSAVSGVLEGSFWHSVQFHRMGLFTVLPALGNTMQS